MTKEKYNYPAGLYLVPTPIGNLEDITLRALRLLTVADIIACEDTRNTGQLLKQYGIVPKKLIACQEHNERSVSEQLCMLAQNSIVCFVSDAGTPLISDPGSILIKTAIKLQVSFTALPGPSALLPALTMSGFSTEQFTFMGFPPHKKGRKHFIDSLEQLVNTVILYESPHRLLSLLEEFSTKELLKNRNMYIVRELTKKYEQQYRGLPSELLSNFQEQGVKGEFVIVLSPVE